MKSFKETFKNEVTLYHGTKYPMTRITAENMFHGGRNQQLEGVGIYFGDDVSVALNYADNVYYVIADKSKFINSREPIGENVSRQRIYKLLSDLNKHDSEEFYYFITDYGIELDEPTDNIPSSHMNELVDVLSREEARNFQLQLTDALDRKQVVKLWNKHMDVQGLYSHTNGYYSVIDTSLKVSKYNE